MSFFCRYPRSDSVSGFLVLPASTDYTYVYVCVCVCVHLYNTSCVLTVVPWAGRRFPARSPDPMDFSFRGSKQRSVRHDAIF